MTRRLRPRPRTFRLERRKRRRSVDILRVGARRLYRPTMTRRRLNRPWYLATVRANRLPDIA